MGVTIKDVAKDTKLAMSTISKYMNGGNVRLVNRAIIEEAIERLGYQPNQFARSLRTSKTYTIGILLPALSDPYSIKIVNIIEQKLMKQGYLSLLCCHRNKYENVVEAVSFLLDKDVDGIILDPAPTEKDYIKPIVDAKIPLVVIDSAINKYSLDYVMVNNTKGVYEAVEDMVLRGHEKIAICTGMKGLSSSDERLKGYIRVFEDYNLKITKDYIVNGDYSFEGGYNAISNLWRMDDRPTAVFICNYQMCLGAVKASHDLNINIPKELSLATFDDMDISVTTNPKLTSVRQPLDEIGKAASKLILKRLNGDNEDFPKFIRLNTTLVPRESVEKIN